MLYTTIINGVDFTPYIRKNGVQQTAVRRLNRSVVTMDGVMHTSWTEKRGLTISLLEMRDVTARRLFSALQSPATVEYTDMRGEEMTKVFHITGFSTGVKTVRGGITYWSGASVTLEEK